jgi:WD40 repeat protein
VAFEVWRSKIHPQLETVLRPPETLRPLRGPTVALLHRYYQRAVSGSQDQTLRVWDLESGKCLAVFTCNAVVFCCAWAKERKERIVAGDLGGHVHLFAWEE